MLTTFVEKLLRWHDRMPLWVLDFLYLAWGTLLLVCWLVAALSE